MERKRGVQLKTREGNGSVYEGARETGAAVRIERGKGSASEKLRGAVRRI
jgi:hypothetical protein